MQLALLLLLLLPAGLQAELRRTEPRWSVGVGLYGSNLEQRVTVPREYQNKVSEITGHLRVSRAFPFRTRFAFRPTLGALAPWRSGEDGSPKTFTFLGSLLFGWRAFSFLELRLGPGLQYLLMTSRAETLTLNNGTGTSPFHTPGRTSHAFLAVVQGGLAISVYRNWTFHLESVVTDLASRSRRRYHGIVAVGIPL